MPFNTDSILKQSLLLLGFCLIILSNVNGQKKLLKIYGAVAINDSVLMKSTEVTVKEWIEFIVNNRFDTTLFPSKIALSKTISEIFEDLKKVDQQKYFIFKTQSLASYNYNPVVTVHYSSYLDELLQADTTNVTINIPITGITFEQANKFCEWKEEILNYRRSIKIKLSLPSIDIYRSAIPNIDSLNVKKCAQFNWAFCNCATITKNKQAKSQGKALLRADSYWPSNLGLYNIQGNAAEMTSKKGIAMGGSFRHAARDSFNDKIQTYQISEEWLGFRYIVTLK
jgi:formylglycine-generating enzyme required for sulfatase activity